MFIGFVDESKSSSYIVVVTLVRPRDLQDVRKSMNALRKPGQSRIHFAKESDRRRREILSVIQRLPQTSHYFISQSKHQGIARAECLSELVLATGRLKVHRLVLEREESYELADRRLIQSLLLQSGSANVEYLHESPAAEPCLWIPDAVAWSIQKGGDWRRRAFAH